MHPILRHKKILRGYLAEWVPLAIIIGFVTKVSSHLSWPDTALVTLPISIILAFVCLSAWYISKSLDLRTTADWKLSLYSLLAAMCASSVVMAFAHLIARLLNHFLPGFEARYSPAVPISAALFSLIYMLSVVLHYLLVAMEKSQRAEVLSREAELKALKAQVNPHFLFNSLNSISALTSIDPHRARDMCIALSEFLRNSLRLGERASVPLGEELALTRSYLDVERVRFGERLRVRQDMETGCTDCDVPPLLVQPLVENAIKHGIATLDEGGEIAVTGRRWHDQLRVTVENPFDPDAPPAQKNGFGLLSVRNRLQARYGSAGKLEIEVGDARYRVVLSLPWDQAVERRPQ
jgi:sensor histidine kinase YesM